MRPIRYAPRAIADLRSIGRFSRDQFGAVQAKRYVNLIETACLDLADARRRGRPAGNVKPGLRKLGVASHVIYFRDEDDLVIVRVLHSRMNVEDHL